MKTKLLLISLLCIGLLSCETDNKRDNESSNNQENVNGEEDENKQEKFDYENVKYPQGAIKGVFSVSDTKKVAFSKGNLQYQASTNTWRFAERQYDMVGMGYGQIDSTFYNYVGGTVLNSDNRDISSTYSGWVDLFGWGTSGYNGKNPYMFSMSSSDYGDGTRSIAGTNYDWGVYNAISNGGNAKGLWRTLTMDECDFLFNSRTNYDKLWSFATVNGIKGVVLLPDSWSLPSGLSFTAASKDFGTNVYTIANWTQMEIAGAVFLPAAGLRMGSSMNDVGARGYYWSSTDYSSYAACNVYFRLGKLESSGLNNRYYGQSVRLVQDVE